MVLNGQNYKLRFTNRGLLNIEKELGIGILSLIKDSERMARMETMQVFIWAGIGSENVTLDDVIDGVNLSDYENILAEITVAFNEAFNVGDQKKK